MRFLEALAAVWAVIFLAFGWMALAFAAARYVSPFAAMAVLIFPLTVLFALALRSN